jgi:Na+/proline symporter
MLAAKNENHAIGATFFFNVLHYAIRPWPWILVALASLIVFPDLESIQEAFPSISSDKLGQDLAYPAMLTRLPSGLLGLVLASLSAAYMSTISTHLNWGASYVVHDLYAQQINPNADEKSLVRVGRLTTIVLMSFSAAIALVLNNALQFFEIILMFGAGTGLVFILRWFWWRINAWTEISAMFASGIISLLISFTPLGGLLFDPQLGYLPSFMKFPFVVFSSTIIWLAVTFLTRAEPDECLIAFYKKTNPGGPGWSKLIERQKKSIEVDKNPWFVPNGIKAMLWGCVLIYSMLFGTGFILYGEFTKAILSLMIASISAWFLSRLKVRIL